MTLIHVPDPTPRDLAEPKFPQGKGANRSQFKQTCARLAIRIVLLCRHNQRALMHLYREEECHVGELFNST